MTMQSPARLSARPAADAPEAVSPAQRPEDAVVTPPSTSRPPIGRASLARLGARLGVVTLAVALWWALTAVVFADNTVLSQMGPGATLAESVQLLQTQTFLEAIGVSLVRLLAGLGMGVLVGVPLGVLFGSRGLLEDATDPIVQFLRMTSPLAWAPLALVLLGTGSGAVVALISIAAVWPIVLGVAAGVRALDPRFARVARSLGATRWETIRTTAIPALAAPTTGAIRVALGISWVVFVPAEMLGVTNGLGYAILNARDNVDYTALAATMFIIGLLGYLLDVFFRSIHRIVRSQTGRSQA